MKKYLRTILKTIQQKPSSSATSKCFGFLWGVFLPPHYKHFTLNKANILLFVLLLICLMINSIINKQNIFDTNYEHFNSFIIFLLYLFFHFHQLALHSISMLFFIWYLVPMNKTKKKCVSKFLIMFHKIKIN